MGWLSEVEGRSIERDLESRLRTMPDTAKTRGVFFNLLEDQLAKRGFGRAVARRVLGERPRKSFALYPTRELLVAYAHAGSLVDADAGQGIRQLFSGTARYYASTWYGEAFRRVLRPDPATAIQYVGATREYLATYGQWRVEVRSHRHVIVHMYDEYFWIETAQRGGCEGMLAACGVDGEVEAELDGPYTGRLQVRWAHRH